MDGDPQLAPCRGQRRIAALIGLSLGLLAGCALLLLSLLVRARKTPPIEEVLANPELRREIVAQLARDSRGSNDSHPDADVARVLAAAIEDDEMGIPLATNGVGMRERDYVIPKPAGLVRVVVLGDSFVYGVQCAAEDRCGARLERYLLDHRIGPEPALEVLHIGVSSWNLVSECAYLRRQLDRLRPALVLHVTVSNDLQDVCGVRGFGVLSTSVPAHPERADSLIGTSRASNVGLGGGHRLLCSGLGWESQTRFEQARARVLELVADLARLPEKPRYLLIGNWGEFVPILHQRLGRFLDPDSVLYPPVEAWSDRSTWIDPNNHHWNPAGHERIARVLFGLIRLRNLLPALELSPWPEAELEARAFAENGLKEAERPCKAAEDARGELIPNLDLATIDEHHARQIHGGVDDEHLASPYVSVLLAGPDKAATLCVRGRALPDTVLTDVRVHVWLEERELGTVKLEPDQEFEFQAAVPSDMRASEPFNVRLVSDDYVYRGDDLRHCVVFELRAAGFE